MSGDREELDSGLAFLAKRQVLRVTEANGLDVDRIGRFIDREISDVKREIAEQERATKRASRR